MYIVYLTTNLKSSINGTNKIYIGVHKTENPDIFDGYLGCGVKTNQPSTYMYPKTPFQMAVKKYGVDSFRRITLYQFDNADDAYKKESELVTSDFIKQSHVYNVSLGGGVAKNYKPLYQFNLDGTLNKKWELSIEASNFYGYPIEKFEHAIHNRNKFLDYYWSTEETIDATLYYTTDHGLPKWVYLYNKDGKLLKMFSSNKECAEYLGMKDISKAIYNQLLILKKYYVSHEMVDEFKVKPRKQNINKAFYVYKSDNTFIGEFVGKELMNVIDLHSWLKINDIFRYKQGWYKDFYISESAIDNIPEKTTRNKIIVDIYDSFGNFIETLDSIKDVKNKYNVPSSKIKNIQLGNRYYNNYIFMYHSSKIVNDIV